MKIPAVQWLKNNSPELLRDLFPEINKALFFDKYIYWPFDRDRIELNIKGKYIKEPNLANVLKVKAPIQKREYEVLKKRKNSIPGAIIFPLKTATRLLINHGGESVLESNIVLHRYFGFPVIYGSAIKGVTRHYCEEWSDEEIDSDTIIKIFGSEPQKEPFREGAVVFADAWPKDYEDLDCLELDIITPHYKDYYEKKRLPSDTMQPEPHQFLAVKKGISFEFVLYSSSSFKGDDKLLEEAKKYVIKALSEIGIGAKTGSSYGYFEPVDK